MCSVFTVINNQRDVCNLAGNVKRRCGFSLAGTQVAVQNKNSCISSNQPKLVNINLQYRFSLVNRLLHKLKITVI